MKRLGYLFLMMAALSACHNNKKSDAYGNFEAVEVTLSSQANGQILVLNILEGDQILIGCRAVGERGRLLIVAAAGDGDN